MDPVLILVFILVSLFIYIPIIYIVYITLVYTFWPRVKTAWLAQVSQLRNMYIQFTNTKYSSVNSVLE